MRSWLYRRLTSFPLKINKFCMTLFDPVNERNIFSQCCGCRNYFSNNVFYLFNFLKDTHIQHTFYCLKEPFLKSCQSESYLFRIDFLSEETCPPAKN